MCIYSSDEVLAETQKNTSKVARTIEVMFVCMLVCMCIERTWVCAPRTVSVFGLDYGTCSSCLTRHTPTGLPPTRQNQGKAASSGAGWREHMRGRTTRFLFWFKCLLSVSAVDDVTSVQACIFIYTHALTHSHSHSSSRSPQGAGCQAERNRRIDAKNRSIGQRGGCSLPVSDKGGLCVFCECLVWRVGVR